MVRRLVLPSLILLSLAITSIACGPVTSTIRINEAEDAVESARLEQAQEYATYEFVSAVEYLAKAEEEWGYSDYQHAELYAQRALEFARAARDRSLANPNRTMGGRDSVSGEDADDWDDYDDDF